MTLEKGSLDIYDSDLAATRNNDLENSPRNIKAAVKKSMIAITTISVFVFVLLLLIINQVSRNPQTNLAIVSNLLDDLNTIGKINKISLGDKGIDNQHLFKNLDQSMSSDKRGWKQVVVVATINMFTDVFSRQFFLNIVCCIPTFLDYFNIRVPQSIVLGKTACAWFLGIGALSYASLVLLVALTKH